MKLLYDLGIFLYGLIVRIASLFNPKAKLFIAGRRNVWGNLNHIKKENIVWFHAASLGEFEQGKPVMELLKQNHPEINLVVSFFSPSGYEQRKDWPLATTCYLPLDTPANAKRFIKLLSPKMAVFIRYEFWANYLDELYKNNIPTAVIAAQFRPDQFAFKSLGTFLRKRIARLDAIMVQYQSAKNLLISQNFDSKKVTVCGDSRFDRVLETVNSAISIPELDAFCGNDPVIILGSCYEKEVGFAKEALSKFPNWKAIYAPHFVDDEYVTKLEKQLSEPAIRFTQFKDFAGQRFLILNTIGKLAAAYRYGHIAIIGGGFRDGIHNIIEPAAFGMPLFFGPNHKSFPEAQAMIDSGFAFEISAESRQKLDQLMSNENNRDELAQRARDFVKTHAGATECITIKLSELL